MQSTTEGDVLLSFPFLNKNKVMQAWSQTLQPQSRKGGPEPRQHRQLPDHRSSPQGEEENYFDGICLKNECQMNKLVSEHQCLDKNSWQMRTLRRSCRLLETAVCKAGNQMHKHRVDGTSGQRCI